MASRTYHVAGIPDDQNAIKWEIIVKSAGTEVTRIKLVFDDQDAAKDMRKAMQDANDANNP